MMSNIRSRFSERRNTIKIKSENKPGVSVASNLFLILKSNEILFASFLDFKNEKISNHDCINLLQY